MEWGIFKMAEPITCWKSLNGQTFESEKEAKQNDLIYLLERKIIKATQLNGKSTPMPDAYWSIKETVRAIVKNNPSAANEILRCL